MVDARFTCPNCGCVQDPMLHTVDSWCGGAIEWRGSSLYCKRCDTRITHFRCDDCDARPTKGECVSSSGACFIATATYGSASAPEVIALRRFRDDVLLSSDTGAVFVRMYYRTSPQLARLVLKNMWLRIGSRWILNSVLWFIHAIWQCSDSNGGC